MKNFRIYAASGIFIALTAVKLLSPAMAADIKRDMVGVIDRNDDYKRAVETIGKKLSFADGDKNDAVSAAKTTQSAVPEEAYTPRTIEQVRQDFSAILPEKTARPAETPQLLDDASAQAEQTQKVPQAVQTFLDSQKQYSDYAVPANVSYDMPALPFAYETPVKGYTSSGFGYRLHPILDVIKFHYGTDFAAGSGDEIDAFADGKVEAAGENDSFGKYIIIDHADGYKTLYAHCSKLYVSSGTAVKKGQKIALVGQTGSATGPHLHFELTSSGTYLNPELYL